MLSIDRITERSFTRSISGAVYIDGLPYYEVRDPIVLMTMTKDRLIERDKLNRGSLVHRYVGGKLYRCLSPVWFKNDPPHEKHPYEFGDLVIVKYKHGSAPRRIGEYVGCGMYRMLHPEFRSIFSFSPISDVAGYCDERLLEVL